MFTTSGKKRPVPYGIYNLNHNRGYVYVGNSADTPQFAVDALASWWIGEGQGDFPEADKILILADRLEPEVVVSHYPTGASKWNPVEHRLFGPFSINWAGKPLRTFEAMLTYIRGTTTETGLKVKAFLLHRHYEKGMKVPDQDMQALNLERPETSPHGTIPSSLAGPMLLLNSAQVNEKLLLDEFLSKLVGATLPAMYPSSQPRFHPARGFF